MSHFQNSVSFGNGFGKTSLTTGFSTKSKVAFPKTEVLGKPLISIIMSKYTIRLKILATSVILACISIHGKEKDMAIEIPGLDTNKGLELCDGDMKTYISTLSLYISNIPQALDRMRNVSEETLRNYTISVHGVKSTSEVVGAEEARKTARELEAMGKAGDLAGILARNDDFIKYVEGLVAGIRSWLEKNGQ